MTVHAASRRVMEKAGLKLVRTFDQRSQYKIPGHEQGDVEYAMTRAGWELQETEGGTHVHGDTGETRVRAYG